MQQMHRYLLGFQPEVTWSNSYVCILFDEMKSLVYDKHTAVLWSCDSHMLTEPINKLTQVILEVGMISHLVY